MKDFDKLLNKFKTVKESTNILKYRLEKAEHTFNRLLREDFIFENIEGGKLWFRRGLEKEDTTRHLSIELKETKEQLKNIKIKTIKNLRKLDERFINIKDKDIRREYSKFCKEHYDQVWIIDLEEEFIELFFKSPYEKYK